MSNIATKKPDSTARKFLVTVSDLGIIERLVKHFNNLETPAAVIESQLNPLAPPGKITVTPHDSS